MPRFKPIDYKRIIRSQYLVNFRRKALDDDEIYGFVLACSDTLTLLHILNTSTYTLNGYSVIRNDDVSLYAVYDRPDYYYKSRVLRLKGIRPEPQPSISLESFSDLLVSIDKLYPLLTIYREEIDNEVCFIGRLSGMTLKTFTLYEIDECAEWIGPCRYRLADITRVEFGDGYDEALALAARPDMKKRRKKGK
ncbi:MAG: hypothetical protein H7Z16_01235 [Pyrinomonadaceae bacterium]|nr:hypothetical protein [Pyrinomonadaceae bacterium]